MWFKIPCYVRETRQQGQRHTSLRPLFFEQPTASAQSLERARQRFLESLRKTLREMGKAARHDALAQMAFQPHYAEQVFKHGIYLKRHSYPFRGLLIDFRKGEQRLGYFPDLELWFQIPRQAVLAECASASLEAYFAQQLKRDAHYLEQAPGLSKHETAWTQVLDLNVSLRPQFETEDPLAWAFLGGNSVQHGEWELEDVGRCLDWLELQQGPELMGRENEFELFQKHFQRGEHVLLVGPSGVGKTALVQALVRARCLRPKKQRERELTWLLEAQKLIAGMSYVGQWEERLLAILKVLQDKQHTLYVDDLLGYFEAGKSANSDLSLMHVLKPFLEKHAFSCIAEITPEALRRLKELDRNLVQHFQIIHLHPPDPEHNRQIVFERLRGLEAETACRFDFQHFDMALQWLGRYLPHQAFPGKAMRFFEQLARRYANKAVDYEAYLDGFQTVSGFQSQILDPKQRLKSDEIYAALAQGVYGQDAAIRALTRAVMLLRGRLNSLDKPLASFLFLGPTGVGKTECAKVITRYLYGDSERLIRFDMNEYLSPLAVQRLIGTLSHPDGLLVSRVRQQPFSVLLFDEIEKAHPSVYDLLLQVLGEGRLSDARGQLADFSHCIILLTSNLGVREASERLGFQGDGTGLSLESTYRRAAERFFKPEFLNRLDALIPFEALTPTQIEAIAEQRLQQILGREGFVRRKVALSVSAQAREKLVQLGYHPQLGARALKRVLEKELVEVVATHLAAYAPESAALVQVRAAQQQGSLEVHTHVLQPQAEHPKQQHYGDMQALEKAFFAFEKALRTHRQQLKATSAVSLQPTEAEYQGLVLHERYLDLKNRFEDIRFQREMGGLQATGLPAALKHRGDYNWRGMVGGNLTQLFGAQDIALALAELLEASQNLTPEQYEDLWHELALLRLLLQTPVQPGLACVRLRAWVSDPWPFEALQQLYTQMVQSLPGLELLSPEAAAESPKQAEPFELPPLEVRLFVAGHCARQLFALEAGLHLFYSEDQRLLPVEVSVLDPRHLALEADSTLDLPAIQRIYTQQGPSLDLGQRLLSKSQPQAPALLQLWLARLHQQQEAL